MNKIKFALIFASYFAISGYTTDPQEYVWTPDGTYEGAGAVAYFDSEKGYGSLIMGNYCALDGVLTHPDKNSTIFYLDVDGGDGVGCPQEKMRLIIKIKDGFAIHALGNASIIEIIQKDSGSDRLADFSGVYEFNYEGRIPDN